MQIPVDTHTLIHKCMSIYLCIYLSNIEAYILMKRINVQSIAY